ncbi:MAG: Glycine-rich cell wall structural protein 1 precursor, partial [Labilithrix sp.]|nr:Glycine-rich cell wall structural protein 1 precursor [Labilithrix sp.]
MAEMQPLAPNALRVAAVWGTTVVALRTLARGDSFLLGDMPGADLPVPYDLDLPPTPLRGLQGGWELDTRGCVGGLLTLRGRAEDPVAIARAGAPVPVMPGDFGLIQYGQLSIFFQYTSQPSAMTSWSGPELLTILAVFCSAILHLGLLGLVRTLMTPPPLAKPIELTNPDEYASRFGLKRALIEPAPPPEPALAGADQGGGKGVKDPGAQDKKPQGGGKKMKGDEGKLGLNGPADHTQTTGEIKPSQHFGGLSEVLEGDTGKEIQNTLKSINSVSSALSGLNSSTVVLGGGGGSGLKGAGSGGGGTGAGTPFGSGTLDT